MGKALRRRRCEVEPPALAALLLFDPFHPQRPVRWDSGVSFLLAASRASAWNIVVGLCRPGVVGDIMFSASRLSPLLLLSFVWGLPAGRGPFPAGCSSFCLRSGDRHPDPFSCRGITSAGRRSRSPNGFRLFRRHWDLVGAADRLQGAVGPAGGTYLPLELPYYYIFLAVLGGRAYTTLEVEPAAYGYYLARDQAGERAARKPRVPVRATKLKALMLTRLHLGCGSLYSIKTASSDPERRLRIRVSVHMVIVAAWAARERCSGR